MITGMMRNEIKKNGGSTRATVASEFAAEDDDQLMLSGGEHMSRMLFEEVMN